MERADDLGDRRRRPRRRRGRRARRRRARSRRSGRLRAARSRRGRPGRHRRRATTADGTVALHAGAEDHLVRGLDPRRACSPGPSATRSPGGACTASWPPGRRSPACRTSAGSRRSPSTTCGWPTARSTPGRLPVRAARGLADRAGASGAGRGGRPGAGRRRGPAGGRPRLGRARADRARHVLRAAHGRGRAAPRRSCSRGWSRRSPCTTPARDQPRELSLSVGSALYDPEQPDHPRADPGDRRTPAAGHPDQSSET